MKNIVVFRLSSDQSTWIADLEAGTVERADAFAPDGDQPQVQGVDLAIATTARADAASHQYFPSRAPHVDGVDFAHAAEARSDAASHQYFPSR